MATFNNRWKPYTNPMGIGAEQLGNINDEVYDEFLRKAEEAYSQGYTPGVTPPLLPGMGGESVAYREGLDRQIGAAQQMGLNGLESVRRVIQARGEARSRGGYSTGAKEFDPSILDKPMNAPARVDDYVPWVDQGFGSNRSKFTGQKGSAPSTMSVGKPGQRAGGVGQPFGARSFGGAATGYAGFGNPKGRGLYDRRS